MPTVRRNDGTYATSTVTCIHCDKPIRGQAITALGGGWVHTTTNRERCTPHPNSTVATPREVI